MIQDISPHRLFNEFQPKTQPNPSDIIICLQGNTIMVGGSSGNMIFPKREDFSVGLECRYLFSLDECRIFLAVKDEIDTLPGFCYMSLKEIRQKMKEPLSYMYAVHTAWQNIRYYKSQPWGNVQDILMGFYCDVDGDSTIRMDKSELKEAVWVKREDIQGQADDWSLTHHMMVTFKEGRKPNFGD